MTRLLYVVSHPIQYQAPLLRRLAREPGIDLEVLFESDYSTARHRDPGFGVEIEWDVPLRDGYDNALLSETDLGRAVDACDAVWLHGWRGSGVRRTLREAAGRRKPVLLRGENWSGAMPDGAGPKGWFKRRYLAGIFAKCRAFLAIGSANRRYYLERGVAAERIFDMPYAVDNDFFAARAATADTGAIRRSLGLAEGAQVILFAGKLIRRKRPDLVLDAVRALAGSVSPRPALVVAGDGELRASLERAAPEGTVFAGFRNQTELPGLYALADVFVMASEREPWGLAINEAMACGTAVVATDQCGAAHDLVDETTGAVVAAGDPSALADGLARALADAESRGRAAEARIALWDFEADVAGLKAALEAVA